MFSFQAHTCSFLWLRHLCAAGYNCAKLLSQNRPSVLFHISCLSNRQQSSPSYALAVLNLSSLTDVLPVRRNLLPSPRNRPFQFHFHKIQEVRETLGGQWVPVCLVFPSVLALRFRLCFPETPARTDNQQSALLWIENIGQID